jgi:hypothetical protein
MSEQPRRFKPPQSIKQRLAERVRRHVEASLLSPGAQRARLLRKTQQADTTARGESVAALGGERQDRFKDFRDN